MRNMLAAEFFVEALRQRGGPEVAPKEQSQELRSDRSDRSDLPSHRLVRAQVKTVLLRSNHWSVLNSTCLKEVSLWMPLPAGLY